jgi:uncharacterized membrane protein YoaK (UPF0700 family)
VSGPRLDGTDDRRIGLVLVCCLAALAGAVDACGISVLKDLYVSFMSGNTTSLGQALGRGDWARAWLIVGIVATFVAGAAAGTVVARLAGRLHLPVVIAFVAAVLVVPVIAVAWEVAAMTFAMAALNASMQRAGALRVSLTFVTGALVTFGRGLGDFLCGDGGDFGWALQLVPWIGMLAGATVAAWCVVRFGDVTFAALPVVAAVLAVAAWFTVPEA